jgi:branched-chain amino acid transport system ATP-binding protein
LSGGEKQMLALARGLGSDPAVLLVDELSMGLAPIGFGQLYESVAEIAATGVSVLVVEQFATIGLRYASYVYVMTHGVVGYRGTSDGAVDAVHAAYLGASA